MWHEEIFILHYQLIIIGIVTVLGFCYVNEFSQTYPPLKSYIYDQNINSLNACLANCNFYNDALTVTIEDTTQKQDKIDYYFDISLNNKLLAQTYQLCLSKNKENQNSNGEDFECGWL